MHKHKYPTVICRGRCFPPEAKFDETPPRRELDFAKNVFNGQLYSTRRIPKYAFGLLTKLFGIFQKPFETNVEVTVYRQKNTRVFYNTKKKKTQATEIQ